MAGRLTLLLMWLLHTLPLGISAAVGRLLGTALYLLNAERRRATLINLRLCFPALAEGERQRLARRHFAAFATTALERGLIWWGTPDRIRQQVRIEGGEHLAALRTAGKPVILLAPHFLGLDIGWTRLCMEADMVTVYARVKNPALDTRIRRGRQRFGDQVLLSRQEGLRRVVSEIKRGRPFYYLPDLDYGARDAVFVPFFGQTAATVTGLARLARLTGAAVLTVITRREASGYCVHLAPPWTDFPTDDLAADTARMNATIEDAIRSGDPAQYLWSHKRFKTRPAGEIGVY